VQLRPLGAAAEGVACGSAEPGNRAHGMCDERAGMKERKKHACGMLAAVTSGDCGPEQWRVVTPAAGLMVKHAAQAPAPRHAGTRAQRRCRGRRTQWAITRGAFLQEEYMYAKTRIATRK
jgi:hypothetical protein